MGRKGREEGKSDKQKPVNDDGRNRPRKEGEKCVRMKGRKDGEKSKEENIEGEKR